MTFAQVDAQVVTVEKGEELAEVNELLGEGRGVYGEIVEICRQEPCQSLLAFYFPQTVVEDATRILQSEGQTREPIRASRCHKGDQISGILM